jgi:hypothetical protein
MFKVIMGCRRTLAATKLEPSTPDVKHLARLIAKAPPLTSEQVYNIVHELRRRSRGK